MSLALTQPIKFYNVALSGHAHRVALFLSMLGLPFENIDVNLAAGDQHTPEFRAMNPFGQVPVIDDNGFVLADSNAILVYLNEKYSAQPSRWMPRDAVGAATVQRWLSVAAGPLASGPALARIKVLFGHPAELAPLVQRSHELLKIMDAYLSTRQFLAGAQATLADIANYSYVAHVPEGDVSLAPYRHIREWLQRVEALDGFVGMRRSRVRMDELHA